MNEIEDILKYSKTLTVLYAEDDPNIQLELSSILEIYFHKVILANDGQEGLTLFKQNPSIELIISDIQMPNMDGLDMIKGIRKLNDTIPVIITTAFNDQEYFIRSIDLNVTRYLIKPIEEEPMEKAFYDVSKSIFEKKEYEQLKIEIQNKELKNTQSDAVSKISDALSTPNIIFQNNKVEFYSTSFSELFIDTDVNIQNITPQSDIFNKKEGCFVNLEQYKDNPINNKYSIGNKFFRIERKLIELENSEFTSEMFLLEDITAEENLFSIF